MYSVVLLAAFATAPADDAALFARRAGGCSGHVAAVQVQAVRVQAAGCSGGVARGHLFHRSDRVEARRAARHTAFVPVQAVAVQAAAPAKVVAAAPPPQAFVIAPPAKVQVYRPAPVQTFLRNNCPNGNCPRGR